MFYSLASAFVQTAAVIIFAPLLNGIIRKLKAISQHRRGMPVLQLYYDIIKLFKKDVVIPEASSWIFRAAPYIYLVSALAAAVFIPLIPQLSAADFAGDALLAIFILSLGRFFLVLAGLDTGSTFGGMGSSREMMISALIEPSIIVTIFTLGFGAASGSTTFNRIFEASLSLGSGIISPVYVLLFAAMLIVVMAETARIPVDDPATHLELTMVHEAMVLEYSGKYLALIQLASSVKQLLYITIIVNAFIPFGAGFDAPAAALMFMVKAAAVSVLVALIEIKTVKLRLFSVPNLAALAFILSLLGFMTGFVFGR